MLSSCHSHPEFHQTPLLSVILLLFCHRLLYGFGAVSNIGILLAESTSNFLWIPMPPYAGYSVGVCSRKGGNQLTLLTDTSAKQETGKQAVASTKPPGDTTRCIYNFPAGVCHELLRSVRIGFGLAESDAGGGRIRVGAEWWELGLEEGEDLFLLQLQSLWNRKEGRQLSPPSPWSSHRAENLSGGWGEPQQGGRMNRRQLWLKRSLNRQGQSCYLKPGATFGDRSIATHPNRACV